jgi:hypothetical protein
MAKPQTTALDEIAIAAKADRLEKEILGEAKPATANVADRYRMLLKSKTDQAVKKVDLLTGEAACRFLGIPVRPYYQMEAGTRGDYYRINQRFARLFEEWQSDPEEAGLRTPASGFWKNIIIRPWNLNYVEDFTDDGVTVLGKMLKPYKAGDVVINARYEAPYMDGTQLSVFAPNLPPIKSNHADKTFVQLVSVNVTQDMKTYVEGLQYGR